MENPTQNFKSMINDSILTQFLQIKKYKIMKNQERGKRKVIKQQL